MGRAISEVLNDDNILIEILIRVGFPTTLVRAALPQAPELDTVVRRVASHSFDAYGDGIWIMHCQNGSIFTRYRKGTEVTHGVYRPLCPERDMDFIPPLPTAQNRMQKLLGAILSKEGDGLSYLYVLAECTAQTKTFKMWANLRMRDHTLEDEDISYAYISQLIQLLLELAFFFLVGRGVGWKWVNLKLYHISKKENLSLSYISDVSAMYSVEVRFFFAKQLQ
ncbi:unnamed protein product [Triticum turgidum subsp. durum]|uniref:F-box protein AT5G49610-like beta-propeller domain-containing protein n=1 Tax=Triticum turgidum subsp. durum TaxID=4567 RepID=A0A9R0XV11_TRITD|nr:unnamed protein product [Triticum turgidum subsp. durum]